jgi:hypothetical protein
MSQYNKKWKNLSWKLFTLFIQMKGKAYIAINFASLIIKSAKKCDEDGMIILLKVITNFFNKLIMH